MPYQQLTLCERESIAQMKYAGRSPEKIGRAMGRAPSTIRREIKRNTSEKGYRPSEAQQQAQQRRYQRHLERKLDCLDLQDEVRKGMSRNWSPETIAGRLKKESPKNTELHVSYQTIYRWIWSSAERISQLKCYLRHGRYRKRGLEKRCVLKNRISISERPTSVDDRSRLGDWEGDTIVGKNHSGFIMTMVERKTGFLIARRMRDKRSTTLNRAAIAGFTSIPDSALRTLTLDNGTEFAKHELLSCQLKMPIYFADPYSSWQRGTNENTNGLLRQYVPKGTDILTVSPTALAFYVDQINNRPRKRLRFKTPNEAFQKLCPSRT